MFEKIPEVFKSQDTLYHFTNSSVAIENILYEKQLRLSPRKKTNDPLEKAKDYISEASAAYPEDMDRLEQETQSILEEISMEFKTKQENIRQICFCMNNKKIRSYDDLGFMKPRMWDQYADKYKGICLAFSKKELVKNAKIILKGKVVYNRFNGFPEFEIDRNKVQSTGPGKYKNDFSKTINDSFLSKHKDYRDENEYRLCSFTDDDYDFINFENSLIGIIVSPYHVNDYTLKALKEYSKNMDVNFLYINWWKNRVTVDKEPHDRKSSNFVR